MEAISYIEDSIYSEYQNITLSLETNEKLKFREVMKGEKDAGKISEGYIVNEKNGVACFSEKY
jgi:hypothetical protein